MTKSCCFPFFFHFLKDKLANEITGASMVAQMVKNLPAMQETQVGSLGQEDTLEGEGNDNPLQYSCLENSMDRRAQWTTVGQDYSFSPLISKCTHIGICVYKCAYIKNTQMCKHIHMHRERSPVHMHAHVQTHRNPHPRKKKQIFPYTDLSPQIQLALGHFSF